MKKLGVILFFIFIHQPIHAQVSLKPDFYRTCTILTSEAYCDSLIDRTKELAGQAKEGGLIMLDTFHNDIRPQVMAMYKAYYDSYGEQVGENFWRSYDYVSPHVKATYERTKEYWYNEYPEFFDGSNYIPTPIKKAHEKLLFAIWDHGKEKIESGEVKLPGILATATEMLHDVDQVREGKVKAPAEDQARLDRLLNDLRASSIDPEMADCFKIYAIPSKITNSFNTVCSIFMNEELYTRVKSDPEMQFAVLNDDELRAVIAHEMSHGVNGDSIKTFAHFLKASVGHFMKLGMEEMVWLLQDETLDYFQETLDAEGGSGEMIMHRIAEVAPLLEMNADVTGTKILNRAGYSAEPLISALYKLHGLNPGDKVEDTGDQKSFRNYPSLKKRIDAIRSVMKF